MNDPAPAQERRYTRLPWALLLLALGVLAGVLFGRAADPAMPAAAQSTVGGNIYMLSGDSFFITSNASGDTVNLWCFERKGLKADSAVYHVAAATSSNGPQMKR